MDVTLGLLVLLALRIAHCEITTSPVNATARACEAANFTCAGMGDFLNWALNAETAASAENIERGVATNTVVDGANISSTLTVPVIKEDDNLTVDCFIFDTSVLPPATDNAPRVYLSVEEPGHVVSLEVLNLTANSVCIGWKQPYMCYNGMDGFEYHVSVEAIDLHEANTVTISETTYCFSIDPCGSYMVTVTPSIQSYNGTVSYLPVNGLGDYYNISEFNTTNVIFENEDSCNVSFLIQSESSDLLCPNRSLLVIIENTTAYSLAINGSTNNISFTVVGLDTEKLLTAIAKIVDTSANTVLNQSQINISTFSLQGFMSDLIGNVGSEIVLFVQCEFAQGSSTIGCLVVADVYGSSILNHTILKQDGSDFAVGNISIPTTGRGGVIQLTAYSINANGIIIPNALPLTQSISVLPTLLTSQVVLPTPSPSATIASSSMITTLASSLAPSLTPTLGVITDTQPIDLVVALVVALVIAAVVVAVVVLIVIAVVYRRRKKQNEENESQVLFLSRTSNSSGSSPIRDQQKAYTDLDDSLPIMDNRFTGRSEVATFLSVSYEPDSLPPAHLASPAVKAPVCDETSNVSPAPPLTPPPVYEEAQKLSQQSDSSFASDAPPGVKAPVYEETSKFSRSKQTDSSSASNVTGIQYAEVKHPRRPIPNIREPPVVYTQLKSQRLYENRKHVGITPDPPPPLPAKKSKLQSLAKSADDHDCVPPPAFRPGVVQEDCNQIHCDQVAESSVLTSVENSDNNVPENVQKCEESVPVAPDYSLSDPVAESPSALASAETSLSNVLEEGHKSEEIILADADRSLSDPVTASVVIPSAETSVTRVSVEEQSHEGEVPSRMVVPSVLPQKASTAIVSVGVNYEGSALKSDTDAYAVHEHEEVSSTIGQGRIGELVFNIPSPRPSFHSVPAIGLLHPVLEVNPSRDSGVCTTGMDLTSDHQDRTPRTEPVQGDTKDSKESLYSLFKLNAQHFDLTKEEIEDIWNSSTTDQEFMERVKQCLKQRWA